MVHIPYIQKKIYDAMINTQTEIFAVFGNPVIHSKSPFLHNFLFRKYQYNGVYLAFLITDIKEAIQSARELGLRGISITLPFKESVIQYLDWIDPEALKIGAVNTVVNQNGKLLGYNTDYTAAIEPLKKYHIKNKNVCIIGAGGAAQAIAFGIDKEGGKVFIANRTPVRGKLLAEKFNGRYISFSKIDTIQADIIINTTSVGMFPDTEVMPVRSEYLSSKMIIMDIVYNPLKTRLLKTAGQKGCQVIDGLTMFISQGVSQFKLWTDITPDENSIRRYFMDQGELNETDQAEKD